MTGKVMDEVRLILLVFLWASVVQMYLLTAYWILTLIIGLSGLLHICPLQKQSRNRNQHHEIGNQAPLGRLLRAKPTRQRNIILKQLLTEHATSSTSEKKVLNRRIWRRRRCIKRLRAKFSMQEAAQRGRFPGSRPKNLVINWHKLCNGQDSVVTLHNHFLSIFFLDLEVERVEIQHKLEGIQCWGSLRTNLLAFQVTMERLSKAIRKLKNGKGSPDGCTAELFRNLPTAAMQNLCSFLSHVFYTLAIPESWTVVGATLIPKVVGAESLSKFRAIACLPVCRKLLGYLWMQTLPTLRYDSFQCGFVHGAHAAAGVYLIKRAAELSREWKIPLYVAQLDLKKAFHRVLHSAVMNALRMQSASCQCIAIMCALLLQSKAAGSLGHVRAPAVHMHRGLPQGAPESPLLFTLVTELVLRPLLARWKQRGSGWSFSGLHVVVICYADDIILVSERKIDLETMISETITAFASVGLEVGTGKSHWSSYPSRSGEKLVFGQDRVTWEASLTFVGTILNFNGKDGLAIDNRIAQANKVFWKWKPVLTCRTASIACRIDLPVKTVFSAALWLSETWHPTKRQRQRLDSWAARVISLVVGVRKYDDEDLGDFWRRMYRTGHATLAAHGGSFDVRRRKKLHSFAGHLARQSGLANEALRTRSLSWWRHFQRARLLSHPCRFAPWRWEKQLVDHYGETLQLFIDDFTGWMLQAQVRGEWKASEAVFAKDNT